ncbi:hypothetical protein ID11_09795 [Pantoea vagans]|nr:hypothetical protein ID11_09795 [Pantoea vagans]
MRLAEIHIRHRQGIRVSTEKSRYGSIFARVCYCFGSGRVVAWMRLFKEGYQIAAAGEVSSMTVSPAGIRFRATDEVVRFVVFRPEPDYVHWRQFRYS